MRQRTDGDDTSCHGLMRWGGGGPDVVPKGGQGSGHRRETTPADGTLPPRVTLDGRVQHAGPRECNTRTGGRWSRRRRLDCVAVAMYRAAAAGLYWGQRGGSGGDSGQVPYAVWLLQRVFYAAPQKAVQGQEIIWWYL